MIVTDDLLALEIQASVLAGEPTDNIREMFLTIMEEVFTTSWYIQHSQIEELRNEMMAQCCAPRILAQFKAEYGRSRVYFKQIMKCTITRYVSNQRKLTTGIPL